MPAYPRDVADGHAHCFFCYNLRRSFVRGPLGNAPPMIGNLFLSYSQEQNDSALRPHVLFPRHGIGHTYNGQHQGGNSINRSACQTSLR